MGTELPGVGDIYHPMFAICYILMYVHAGSIVVGLMKAKLDKNPTAAGTFNSHCQERRRRRTKELDDRETALHPTLWVASMLLNLAAVFNTYATGFSILPIIHTQARPLQLQHGAQDPASQLPIVLGQ